MKQTYVQYTRDEAGLLTRQHDIRKVADAIDVEGGDAVWEGLSGWPEFDVYWERETGPSVGWAPVVTMEWR